MDRSVSATHHGQQRPDRTHWYEWDSDESEHGWLLSYVDVLSVILAMLVVLLGRLAVDHLPPAMRLDPPAEYRDAPASAPAIIDRAPTADAQPVPERPLEPLAPEQRFTELVSERFAGQVTAVRNEQGVSVEIADVILFQSARAELQPSALPILARLTATLREIGEADIAVEGHTDNRPLRGGVYGTNWELAAARAAAVTRFLLSKGIPPERLRSVSYADTRPAANNDSDEGRAANRRVALRVEFVTD